MIRYDPDVLMVGEIRDRETAQIAIESALTGHLVLSTFTPGTRRWPRLGWSRWGSSRSWSPPASSAWSRSASPAGSARSAAAGVGHRRGARQSGFERRRGDRCLRAWGVCSMRRNGLRGRVGLYEIMVLSDEIRALILRKASADGIRRSRGWPTECGAFETMA